MPSPAAVDFKPGELLGGLAMGLGLRDFLCGHGHTLMLTSDREGSNAEFDQILPGADILIIQACWPAALTAERIARAPRLKLVITAGTGSGTIDLGAAARRGLTVAEITQSDSVSAAEHAVMLVLSLVHNMGPASVSEPPREIASWAGRAYDLEGMHVGCVGAGRTGHAFLRRLRPFDVRLHYADPRRLPLLVENELGLIYHARTEDMVRACDVVAIHSPLNSATTGLFGTEMIGRMKRGAYLINTSAAAICESDAVAQALNAGRLAGFASDTIGAPSASGLDAHAGGATLSAQARYAAGVREVLECWFANEPIRARYLMIDRGQPTAAGIRSYGILAGCNGG